MLHTEIDPIDPNTTETVAAGDESIATDEATTMTEEAAMIEVTTATDDYAATDESAAEATQTIVDAPSVEDSPEAISLKAKMKSNFTSLVLMLVVSIINIPMMLFGNRFFFFSLSSTTYITELAYQYDRAGEYVGLRDTPEVIMIVAICLVIIAVFGLLIWLSHKGKNWALYAALALFILDCVVLAFVSYLLITSGFADSSTLLNILFHAWILYSFIAVIKARGTMRRI